MTEAEIQKAVFSHLKKRALPGVAFWHCPNDKSSRRKAGYTEGASDLMAVCRGNFYAIELKKDGGRPTDRQLEFLANVNSAGGYGVVAEGLTEALRILVAWGLMRPGAEQ